MDTKEIQKLIDIISGSTLDEVSIETSELKLKVKKNNGTTQAAQMVPIPALTKVEEALISTPIPVQAAATSADILSINSLTSKLIEVKSPMIGTFYRAASPGKPNFVENGDEIQEGKVVCVIEAMKLFNEIESEVKGKIVKVLVEDATPVEFDQPLFLVESI